MNMSASAWAPGMPGECLNNNKIAVQKTLQWLHKFEKKKKKKKNT